MSENLRQTVPTILKRYAQTGEFPHAMLPIEDKQSSAKDDPTKPLRGSFEAILLAREDIPTLHLLQNTIAADTTAWHHMVPLDEIDLEDEYTIKIDKLAAKADYVSTRYLSILKQLLTLELDEQKRASLPAKVAFAYDQLEGNTSIEDIVFAAESLRRVFSMAFTAAHYYPQVLGYEPRMHEVIDLIGNSYESFVHPLTVRHDEVDTLFEKTDLVFGEDFTIDQRDCQYRISIVDVAQYIRREIEMRKEGTITSSTIRCPFSINAQFTEPFLDPNVQPVAGNPLRHTFERLVYDFIGR